MSRRNQQIDGLRGIAILLVVLFHFFCRYFQLFAPDQAKGVLPLTGLGGFGVCVFLVITGFFLVNAKNQGKFFMPLLKRVLRLWPVYLFCVTIIFIVVSIWPLPGRTQSFATYLINATMLNGFLGIPYVDSAHWYLTTLLSVNFISILLHKCKLQNKLWVYYTWMAAVSLLTWAKTIVSASSTLTMAMGGAITLMGGGWVGCVIAGIALMRIRKKRESHKAWKEWALLATSYAYIYWMNDAVLLVEMIFALLVVWLALNEKLRFLQHKAIVYLGTISYSVYLIHQNIGYVIMYHSVHQFGIHHYAASLVAFAATFLLGLFIYHFFERPGSYLIQKIPG